MLSGVICTIPYSCQVSSLQFLCYNVSCQVPHVKFLYSNIFRVLSIQLPCSSVVRYHLYYNITVFYVFRYHLLNLNILCCQVSPVQYLCSNVVRYPYAGPLFLVSVSPVEFLYSDAARYQLYNFCVPLLSRITCTVPVSFVVLYQLYSTVPVFLRCQVSPIKCLPSLLLLSDTTHTVARYY
jgi:hypothetical protein